MGFPVAIFSIPKSGTHMLKRLTELLGRRRSAAALWSLTQIEPEVFTADDVPVLGLRGFRPPPPSGQVRRFLAAVGEDEYTVGHPAHTTILAELLRERGFRILFLCRDPRDLACSLADWLIDPIAPDATRRAHFADSTFADRLSLVLQGGALEPGARIDPIARHFGNYLGWCGEPGTLTLRYEDLVGPSGGGARDAQHRALAAICRHLEIDLQPERAERILEQLYGGTRTFRHGRIGRWREVFDAHHHAAIEAAAPLLVRLGYPVGTAAGDGAAVFGE
jgi:hypothetical protein